MDKIIPIPLQPDELMDPNCAAWRVQYVDPANKNLPPYLLLDFSSKQVSKEAYQANLEAKTSDSKPAFFTKWPKYAQYVDFDQRKNALWADWEKGINTFLATVMNYGYVDLEFDRKNGKAKIILLNEKECSHQDVLYCFNSRYESARPQIGPCMLPDSAVERAIKEINARGPRGGGTGAKIPEEAKAMTAAVGKNWVASTAVNTPASQKRGM